MVRDMIYINNSYYKDIIIEVYKEKEKISIWLNNIFGFSIDSEIIFESYIKIGAQACSVKNKIYICFELLNYKKSLLNFYLPHEMIHQYLGIYITFIGEFSLFILEILVEFTQYFYIKEKNIHKFYENHLRESILNFKNIPNNMFSRNIIFNVNTNYIDPYLFKIGVYILIKLLNDFILFKKFLNKIIMGNGTYSFEKFLDDVEIVFGEHKKVKIENYFNIPLNQLLIKIKEDKLKC